MFFAIIAIAVVLAAFLAVRGWLLLDEFRMRAFAPDGSPDQPDLEVVDIQEDQVTLRLTSIARRHGPVERDGIWGMEWDGGYAQVGEISHVGNQRVVREFRPLIERPSIGDLVRLSGSAYPGDPQKAFGLPFEEISFKNERIQRFNTVIEKLCLENEIPFVNLYKEMITMNYPNFLSDGLHPNGDGYDFMFKVIKEYLDGKNLIPE